MSSPFVYCSLSFSIACSSVRFSSSLCSVSARSSASFILFFTWSGMFVLRYMNAPKEMAVAKIVNPMKVARMASGPADMISSGSIRSNRRIVSPPKSMTISDVIILLGSSTRSSISSSGSSISSPMSSMSMIASKMSSRSSILVSCYFVVLR